jgi:acetylornithine deacetylase/succinyl-diaminopimelate desuccinylase-like protein
MSESAYDPELTDLLSKLVSIRSPSGMEGEAQRFIAEWFSSRGLPAVLEPADGGLFNVVVEVAGAGPGPSLWIGGHSDTVVPSVGWSYNPHTPTIAGKRLYGVGAMDMKSGLATAMHAVRDLAARRDSWTGKLTFVSLADEEATSRGAKSFIRTGRPFDAAIMCEPNFEDPATGAVGKVNLCVRITGLSAHGAWPERGINAVTEASRLVAAIGALDRRAHHRFGKGTHCVLNISSGDGKYEIRVPDHCEFLLNWHFMPGETIEEAVQTLEALVNRLGSRAKFEIITAEPSYGSYALAESDPFVTSFAETYRRHVGRAPELGFCLGVSDANVLAAEAGVPTILFGPSGANLHAADEWADLSQMAVAKAVYTDLALGFLSGRDNKETP